MDKTNLFILFLSISSINVISAAENFEQNNFEIFTNLYNHNLWTVNNDKSNVSFECSSVLENYLLSLKNSTIWAVKASDASGRYRGNYLMKNTFWMGSKSSCLEINKGKNPEFSFFVANILLKIAKLDHVQNVLQVAQCLPKSCTKEDVWKVLENDVNAMELEKNLGDDFKIMKVRNIPGNYQLFSDSKFLYFM